MTVVAAEPSDAPDDPEAFAAVAASVRSAVEAAVARHGGAAAGGVGIFGHPALREDDVLRAARAALELAATHGARVGLATGEIITAAEGVVGRRWRSRASSPATPFRRGPRGASTLALLGGAAETEVAGRVGAVVPARLVSLDPGVLTPPRADSAPFVGRRDELDRLLAAARSLTARVVTVIGDPGVGKTRLVAELATRLEPETATLVARCVPYGAGASWAPVW